VKITPLGGGRYEIVSDSGRSVAYGVRRAGETWVHVDGRVYVVGTTSGGARRGGPDEATLSAPMPATVVAINVTPGHAVKAGDVLVLLEAMKMELSVTAPLDGRVREVNCRVGELVQPGVPLIDLESA
jgi:biotin carboxyl carrier protein